MSTFLETLDLKKIKTGDLVRWHTLAKVTPPILPGRARSRTRETEPTYKENIGIVTSVLVESSWWSTCCDGESYSLCEQPPPQRAHMRLRYF